MRYMLETERISITLHRLSSDWIHHTYFEKINLKSIIR